ncbi:Uu.00g078710.m01.CDS01 [Anthostomella pinea]|uniref:Uu.00g078710.m01.CDS01 n=1 Tax=Anthostomella pinea TaxID=933095 RepID=A0AAI8VLT3_9PEZI|nr:Uu.00g078710.m01.CDS01 [Anthostomella pinea]
MQDVGVFVQQWPTILGCDVAGVVHGVGALLSARFKKGNRVIGHVINLVSGRPQDGAFALYSVVSGDKVAILSDAISFKDVPFALEAAVCVLSPKQPGTAMPNISAPALGLPYPLLEPPSIIKTLMVYGGSSPVGSMTTQLAMAACISVIAVASEKNFDLCRSCGEFEVFDYHDEVH